MCGPRKRVGTGRTAERCLPIPPVATVRATFMAHGDPRRGPLRRLGSADLRETSPALTPYGASSVDGYFAHLSRCGPSPCTRLSRAPSTMATLTPFGRLWSFGMGFPIRTSASIRIVRRVSQVPRDGLPKIVSVAVLPRPVPALAGSSVDIGYIRWPMSSFE